MPYPFFLPFPDPRRLMRTPPFAPRATTNELLRAEPFQHRTEPSVTTDELLRGGPLEHPTAPRATTDELLRAQMGRLPARRPTLPMVNSTVAATIPAVGRESGRAAATATGEHIFAGNPVGVPVPSLPGREAAGPTPYSREGLARYRYVMERVAPHAGQNVEQARAAGYRGPSRPGTTPGEEIVPYTAQRPTFGQRMISGLRTAGIGAMQGLTNGSGAIGGAISGAIAGLRSPTDAADFGFNAFQAPAIRAQEEQELAQRQRAQQELAQAMQLTREQAAIERERAQAERAMWVDVPGGGLMNVQTGQIVPRTVIPEMGFQESGNRLLYYDKTGRQRPQLTDFPIPDRETEAQAAQRLSAAGLSNQRQLTEQERRAYFRAQIGNLDARTATERAGGRGRAPSARDTEMFANIRANPLAFAQEARGRMPPEEIMQMWRRAGVSEEQIKAAMAQLKPQQ